MSTQDLTKEEAQVIEALRKYGPYVKLEIDRVAGKIVMITGTEKTKLGNSE